MIVKEVVILNPSGLHARPAASFAALAGKFASQVQIKNLTSNSNSVNAKSMLMILTLGLSRGMRAELLADGLDEEAAICELASFVECGCGEGI